MSADVQADERVSLKAITGLLKKHADDAWAKGLGYRAGTKDRARHFAAGNAIRAMIPLVEALSKEAK